MVIIIIIINLLGDENNLDADDKDDAGHYGVAHREETQHSAIGRHVVIMEGGDTEQRNDD